VSAVLAFKLVQAPWSMFFLIFLPMPILFVEPAYCSLTVKEREYCDSSAAKLGGATFGLLYAIGLAVIGAKVPTWLRSARPPGLGP